MCCGGGDRWTYSTFIAFSSDPYHFPRIDAEIPHDPETRFTHNFCPCESFGEDGFWAVGGQNEVKFRESRGGVYLLSSADFRTWDVRRRLIDGHHPGGIERLRTTAASEGISLDGVSCLVRFQGRYLLYCRANINPRGGGRFVQVAESEDGVSFGPFRLIDMAPFAPETHDLYYLHVYAVDEGLVGFGPLVDDDGKGSIVSLFSSDGVRFSAPYHALEVSASNRRCHLMNGYGLVHRHTDGTADVPIHHSPSGVAKHANAFVSLHRLPLTRPVYCVTFYSEGAPHDRGLSLAGCLPHVKRECRIHFLPLAAYTPRILRDMEHGDCVDPFDDVGTVTKNPGMSGIGNSAFKPRVLLMELRRVPPGAIVVYRDVNHKKYPLLASYRYVAERAAEAIRLCGADVFVGREGDDFRLEHFTKGNVLKELGDDDAFVKTFPLLQCHTVIARRSPQAEAFLREWDAACSHKPWIDGSEHGTPNPDLRWSTPEQSLFGVIAAKWVRDGRFPHDYPRRYQDRGRLFGARTDETDERRLTKVS
jgi:hypothetical protein